MSKMAKNGVMPVDMEQVASQAAQIKEYAKALFKKLISDSETDKETGEE